MSTNPNVTHAAPRRVLMVAASPMTSPSTGWPVGFWASELTHPYLVFRDAGYEVVIASPQGGAIEMDAMSDPRHESGYSAADIISMGFVHTPALAAMLQDTVALSDVNPAEYDAVVVLGGMGPMFQFRDNEVLQHLMRAFYEARKPTAALCHGVSSLIDVRLSDGSYLIEGRTITGFSNAEDDYADSVVGTRLFPWRVETAARERGANYIQAGMWKAFAVRDGHLITGQQQFSGAETARLVVEALGQ